MSRCAAHCRSRLTVFPLAILDLAVALLVVSSSALLMSAGWLMRLGDPKSVSTIIY